MRGKVSSKLRLEGSAVRWYMWEIKVGDQRECAGYPYFGVCWCIRFAFGSGVMSSSIASGVWYILHDDQRDHFSHQNSRISPFPTSSPKCLKSMIFAPHLQSERETAMPKSIERKTPIPAIST